MQAAAGRGTMWSNRCWCKPARQHCTIGSSIQCSFSFSLSLVIFATATGSYRRPSLLHLTLAKTAVFAAVAPLDLGLTQQGGMKKPQQRAADYMEPERRMA